MALLYIFFAGIALTTIIMISSSMSSAQESSEFFLD